MPGLDHSDPQQAQLSCMQGWRCAFDRTDCLPVACWLLHSDFTIISVSSIEIVY